MNVAKTFEKHGVLFSVGGYSHYSGGGMYVEHNQKQSYWHALSSPEWFKWFTSANHNQSGNNIKESPFYLKDKNACKQNVMDLCTNSKLSDEEKKEVMNLFEKTWKTLGTKQMCTALIPRSEIGKNNIDETIPNDASLEESMVYALNDLNGQFSEHNGNCLTETLYANQMQILDLPNADKFVSCKDYKRESKEELLNPKQIFDRINGGLIASNKLSLSDNQVSNLINRLNEEYSDEQSILNYVNNRHQQLLEYPNYNVNSSTKIIPITQDEIDEVKENNPDEFEMRDEIEIKKDNKQKNHISSIEKE